MESQPRSTRLYAPNKYPTAHTEVRAYTIAAFRVAQNSDQLSLIIMPKPQIDFLVKAKAVAYWKERGWISEQLDGYNLTPEGLVVCQSAIADQLPTHNACVENVEFWTRQFRTNSTLPRSERFDC